jgi:hypothetical protein
MKTLILGLIFISLSACAVNITPQATGGSRADGTVEFTYSYGSFQVPEVNWAMADMQAAQRCSTWGYSGADRFGGGVEQCSNTYQGSCNAWNVTVTYQCSGQPDVVR